MRYGRQPSLTYNYQPRSYRRLHQKAVPAKAKTVAKKTAQTSKIANVMDVMNFLAKYLSGKQNVIVAPERGVNTGFAVAPRVTGQGREYFQVTIPHWDSYDLPLKGFDKYRIFREGVWHEACHIKYTPRALYPKGHRDIVTDLINLIEDRRIEDLGVKEWAGYLPERLYVQAYAYAVRPSVEQINDPETRKFEAFLQRLLIGKVKGKLPLHEEHMIEYAAKTVESALQKLEGEKNDYKIEREIVDLANWVKSYLGLSKSPAMKSYSDMHWEDTFSENYGASMTPEEVEEGMDEFFKAKEKEAKGKTRQDGKTKPTEITEDDVEKAKKGSEDVQSEYEQKIQKKEPIDPTLFDWRPVASQASPSEYRDAKFIQTMNTYLQSWREGFIRKVGKTGMSFSVKEYIKHKDEPFVTKLKQSAKGKKLLILADFSGSMADREDDYKKALISSLEVLNSIGCNVALFAFGTDPAQGDGFYRIKTFEEQTLKPTHLAKLAAIQAHYQSTPTASAYRKLTPYIRKTNPEIVVTITDGMPDEVALTQEEVERLRRFTRMVAFGISPDASEKNRQRMEETLKWFKYNKAFAVTHVHQIPPKLVDLLTT